LNDSSPQLDVLFNPASIVLVGASNSTGKMGNLFAKRLKEGFQGRLYAVHPQERDVMGIPTYASVKDVPGSIDLMLALLPGPALVQLMEDCSPGKLKFLAAIPSGFGEVVDGQPLQKRLRVAAAACGAALLGPNTVGLMNCERGVNASMIPILPPGGKGVSCLTQSGGFGMALAMYALDHGVPIAKFCDIGNMAGLRVEELLAYYGEDPATQVVLLFLEAVSNPDRFIGMLEDVSQHKPVVLSVLGSTTVGQRASKAHLGLAPNLTRALERLPARVVLTTTGQDALDACKALLWQRRPSGRRIAVITGTGGIGAEIADLAALRGLELPELSTRLQEALRAHLPPFAATGNPIDVTPIWWEYPRVYPAMIGALDNSDEVDLLVLSITDVPTTFPELAEALCTISDRVTKPLCVFWGSRNRDLEPMRRLEGAGIPCYRSTTAAVNAAAALAHDRLRVES
jgi:acetyltransferase